MDCAAGTMVGMATVELRAMTPAEYEAFMARAIGEYAEDKARAGDFDPETAYEESRAECDRLLPDGLDTAGHLLLTAVDGGTAVGLLWLALPGVQRRSAWVFDIRVDEEHRGRGYGRAIMLAGERVLVERGVGELGLNVFGDNTVARHLYESLGFRVTAQQMAKPLGG